jgi:hypothetical protein
MAEDEVISFIPENDVAFKRALEKLAKAVDDFRIPFGLIGRDWYKSNKIIFTLKSGGLYAPLGGFNPNQKDASGNSKREKAEARKKKEVGFVFPLLVGKTGALKNSLLSPGGAGAEFFVGRQSLIMGTSVEYAKYHQSDAARSVLPQRKVIFIDGGPAEKSKGSKIAGRRERWLNIMEDYIGKVTEKYNNG